MQYGGDPDLRYKLELAKMYGRDWVIPTRSVPGNREQTVNRLRLPQATPVITDVTSLGPKQPATIPCGECKGTGQYVGFKEIEPCSVCKGTKVIPNPKYVPAPFAEFEPRTFKEFPTLKEFPFRKFKDNP